MTNRQAAQETRNVTTCEFLLVPANAAIYEANVAFSTIATKMQTDSAAAVVAGDNAAADNTGYSLDKEIAKDVACQVAAQLSASSKVKMDLMGNKSKIQSKVINAIKAIVKDCPEFTSKLDTKQDISKEMEKDALQKYQEMEKQIAEGKKKLKTKKEKNAFEAEAYTEYSLRPFLNLTEDYKKMCK